MTMPLMTEDLKKLRIFLADDHELVRHGIRALLQARRSWTVVGEAADGKEALEKTTILKPDVAILDVEMPNLDGLQVTRLIREATPSVKVIILTMHESHQVVARALKAGACGYVLKSDQAKQLIEAITTVSQGQVFLSPKVSSLVLKAFRNAGKESASARPSQNQLTPREHEIIRLVAQGKTNKETAGLLGIAIRTVESHRSKIMLKLDLHSLTELIHYAIGNEIVSAQEF
jgi:DNA-binding NarL/FixJ family response regulator